LEYRKYEHSESPSTTSAAHTGNAERAINRITYLISLPEFLSDGKRLLSFAKAKDKQTHTALFKTPSCDRRPRSVRRTLTIDGDVSALERLCHGFSSRQNSLCAKSRQDKVGDRRYDHGATFKHAAPWVASLHTDLRKLRIAALLRLTLLTKNSVG